VSARADEGRGLLSGLTHVLRVYQGGALWGCPVRKRSFLLSLPPMRRLRKVILACLGLLAVLALLVFAAVYGLSGRRLGRVHPVPTEAVLPMPADSASVARGRHLATSVATCVLCHGEDFGGAVYADAGPLGIVVGSNLTRGRGGVGGVLTDADWERAIRHGVRRDGTSLIVMPSEVYVHLSDRDLAALVAYLKQVPPVDRELPPTRFRLLGRALLAAGRLPLLVAEKTPLAPHVAAVEPEATAAYGRYLADIGGCHGCHGYGLSGGRVAGPSDVPPASNLTPASLGHWTEADFVRALRAGERPGGAPIHDFMPWRVLGRMTDDELHALWQYIRAVPPKAFGNK
jgi:cytochrome c553